jgi:hypothetical protein
MALYAVAWLTKANLTIYSPIVHYHAVAAVGKLPTDSRYWAEHNFNMIKKSNGLIILKLNGWSKSEGVRTETTFCKTMCHLPIWGLEYPTKMEFVWERLG